MTTYPVCRADLLHLGADDRYHRGVAVTVGALLDALDVHACTRPLAIIIGAHTPLCRRWRAAVNRRTTNMAEITALAGRAHYLSTACLHAHHGDCKGTCKWCDAICRCTCHTTPPADAPAPATDVPEPPIPWER